VLLDDVGPAAKVRGGAGCRAGERCVAEQVRAPGDGVNRSARASRKSCSTEAGSAGCREPGTAETGTGCGGQLVGDLVTSPGLVFIGRGRTPGGVPSPVMEGTRLSAAIISRPRTIAAFQARADGCRSWSAAPASG